MDDLDEWLATQASDPAKNKTLEEFFEKHPDLRSESVANLQAMERGSINLLQREDCRFLLLPNEEVESWVFRLSERLNQSRPQDEVAAGNLTEESARRMFNDLLLPLLREMAGSIFTESRLRELISGLKKYRNEKFVESDRAAAAMATGAINSLQREDGPGENAFVISLCWTSLSLAIPGQAKEAGAVF